jgi:hypothetical protein
MIRMILAVIIKILATVGAIYSLAVLPVTLSLTTPLLWILLVEVLATFILFKAISRKSLKPIEPSITLLNNILSVISVISVLASFWLAPLIGGVGGTLGMTLTLGLVKGLAFFMCTRKHKKNIKTRDFKIIVKQIVKDSFIQHPENDREENQAVDDPYYTPKAPRSKKGAHVVGKNSIGAMRAIKRINTRSARKAHCS